MTTSTRNDDDLPPVGPRVADHPTGGAGRQLALGHRASRASATASSASRSCDMRSPLAPSPPHDRRGSCSSNRRRRLTTRRAVGLLLQPRAARASPRPRSSRAWASRSALRWVARCRVDRAAAAAASARAPRPAGAARIAPARSRGGGVQLRPAVRRPGPARCRTASSARTAPPGRADLQGPGVADQAHQRRRAGQVGHQAEAGLAHGERDVVGHHPQVARQRQLEPGADRVALHGADDDGRHLATRRRSRAGSRRSPSAGPRSPRRRAEDRRLAGDALRRQHAAVQAGRERRPLGAQHDDADRRVQRSRRPRPGPPTGSASGRCAGRRRPGSPSAPGRPAPARSPGCGRVGSPTGQARAMRSR